MLSRYMSDLMIPLRGCQAVSSVITLALTAYDWWSKYWRDMAPAEINFLLFNSIWTLGALAYIIGTSIQTLRLSRYASSWAVLALDALNMTFWFAGFVALMVFLNSRVCFGNVCNVARAGAGFAVIEWLLFAATTIYTTMYAVRSHQATNFGKRLEDEHPVPTQYVSNSAMPENV